MDALIPPYVTFKEWKAMDAYLERQYTEIAKWFETAQKGGDHYLAASWGSAIAGLVNTRYALYGVLVASANKYGATTVGLPQNHLPDIDRRALDILRSMGLTEQDLNIKGDKDADAG